MQLIEQAIRVVVRLEGAERAAANGFWLAAADLVALSPGVAKATPVIAAVNAKIVSEIELFAAGVREQVPGCELGRLQAFATQVGIRETRRIEGDHVLTSNELLEPTNFTDAIAAGAYPIDIHPATGGELEYKSLGEKHAYQIPFRSLIPTTLDNALVAGRGVSATHEALAAIRVMTISMAVGQAAGLAASMAASGDSRGAVREVDVNRLRAMLQKQGSVLG